MRRPMGVHGMLGSMGSEEPISPAPHEGWLERARGGDREAFDRLAEAHIEQVWRVVWRIVRHREDTEDVVQEVFMTAYRSIGEFRGEASLSTWLHRIAVTRALNHLDRSSEKVRRAAVPIEETGESASDEDSHPSAHPPVAPGPSPLQELEASELMRRLSECLSRMPAAWRAVLSLRDGEDLAYDEIAKTLSLHIGTVRSRLARARLALRACVEGQTT
jgi:RNA polymerase sigma-70 factor (ECF subfamily)